MIPKEVICLELGMAIGVRPWLLEEEDYDPILRYWEVLNIRNAAHNKGQGGQGSTGREGMTSDQVHAAARGGRDIG